MKIYGKPILTPPLVCRFPDIQSPKEDGGYQIELVCPIDRAMEVQDMLYGGDTKCINFNKASEKAKVPRKLFFPVYLYDDEAKEPVRDDEGEKVESEEEVVFRFKSQYRPKIQFKAGLDTSATIGAGSLVQVSGALFGSDEKKDDKGKPLKYVLLTLKGVRVHTIVEKASQDAFAGHEDDGFEDEMVDENVAPDIPETKTSNTSSKDF